MKHLYTLVFCFFAASSFSQWTPTDIPFSGRYEDLFFLNDTVGWTTDGSGKIFKCTDGQNWELMAEMGTYCRSIEFANADLGFCGSLESEFYKTTDGGQTWTDIADLIDPKPEGICGLSIPEPTVVYGCGFFASPAYVVKSTDSGNSWVSIDLSEYASALVDVYFINADTGFVSGRAEPESDGGIVLYTEDGGSTWTVKHRTLYPSDLIWKLQTPDGQHYFGSIQATGASGNTRMIKSSDGGQTWTTNIVANEYNYTQMIGFISPERGWTGGGNSGDFYETFDGGETWSETNFGGMTFNRFVRLNENLAYLSGNKIFRYQVDSIVGIVEPAAYDEVHQLMVSPNPAGENITISVDFKTKTSCELVLYDASGNLVQTLMKGRVGPVKKEITVPVSSLAPQNLFVVLRTNEGQITRKIVKR